MTDLRDTDPEIDPTWLGPDYPAKTVAQLDTENAKPRERVRGFADRWGSPWLVFPVVIALIVSLWEVLFKREKSCPKPKK